MSFLAPAFLAGLLAIGIPWWLHRLSAENPNRKPFSSIMFLEAGEPQRVLARQVQYLLLLAARIGIIAAIVLAFLQPAIWRNPAAGAVGDQRLHVVVVDTSASMAAGDRWDEAIDTTVDLIDSVPISDPVQVIAAGRVLEIVTAPTLDKTVARQRVQSLEPGIFHVDYGQLTRSLDGVLRTAELPTILHFVTDAQTSALPTRFSELAPTEPVEIEIHAVAGGESNWAVSNLFGSALTGDLAATVSSFAQTSGTKTLTLELEGIEVDRQTVTLAAGEQAVVEFAPLDLQPGANRVSVVMSPSDELAADDVRMLALNRPVPHPVLVVSGELTGTADTRFLTDAMSVLQGLALEPTTIGATALADESLDDYEFIVVADAAVLDDDDAERLQDYVESGGGLLLALAARSLTLDEVPVTGHEFTNEPQQLVTGAAGSAVTIGTIAVGHPALVGLDTLRAVRFLRYAELAETEDDEVLIRLETGDPLLIERTPGNGRLLLFASSLDRQWNDLPREPVFVPFIAGLADHLLGGAGFTNEATLGSTLALQAMGMSGGQIFAPDGSSALGLGAAGTDVLLDQVGFYELVGGGRSELVAVNFDGRESALGSADESTLMRWQDLGRAAAAETEAAGVVQEEIQVPLGYWLLLLVLVAVIVESGLGNWHLRVRRGIAA